jgi:hypothetical protein
MDLLTTMAIAEHRWDSLRAEADRARLVAVSRKDRHGRSGWRTLVARLRRRPARRGRIAVHGAPAVGGIRVSTPAPHQAGPCSRSRETTDQMNI